jgi:hypothetical protein
MTVSYKAVIRNPGGHFISEYPIISMRLALALNSPGAATIIIEGDMPSHVLPDGTQVEVWRRIFNYDHLMGQTRFILNEATYIWEGRPRWELSCEGATSILGRRIVGYKRETIFSDKIADNVNTAPADDLMKAFVRENMGTLATDTTRNLNPHLSVEADKSEGVIVEIQAAWRNLLTVLKELANNSANQGTSIYFTVRAAGENLVFQTSVDYLGVDLSDRIVFSTQSGNIQNARLRYKYNEETNMTYVGGYDEGARRLIVEVVGERATASVFSRRESFVDARDFDDPPYLASIGRSIIGASAPKVEVEAEAIDTNTVRFGRDYDFGDKVRVQVGNLSVDCLVSPVDVTYEDGVERKTIRLIGKDFII